VPHGDDDGPELLARRREVILPALGAALSLDHADLLQLAQALDEQRLRHARDAAADVVEAAAAA
jgi:hypothetical protein